jgi:hypothetical protein
VKSSAEAELTDLFAGNGENAKKVEEIAKIDVRYSQTFVVVSQNSSIFSSDLRRPKQTERTDVQELSKESERGS